MTAVATAAISQVGLVPASAGGSLTFLVTSTADLTDANPGDGVCATSDPSNPCTLRAAIQEADATATSTSVTIDVPAGTYQLAIAPSGGDTISTGDLNATRDVTVVGAGSGQTIVDGGQLDRVLRVSSGASVELSALTIRNGLVGDDPSLFLAAGGGIFNSGALTLDDVNVTGNFVSDSLGYAAWGGGIYGDSTSSLTIKASTVNGNTSSSPTQFGSAYGGGIAVNGHLLTVDHTTVTGNSASAPSQFGAAYGGGIVNYAAQLSLAAASVNTNIADAPAAYGGGVADEGGSGSVLFDDVQVEGNTAGTATASPNGNSGFGGGLYLPSAASYTIGDGSTIANNTVDGPGSGSSARGGGIEADNPLTISNSTVSGNQTNGGVAYGAGVLGESNLSITGSRIATNSATATNGNPAYGGGVAHFGALSMVGSTVSGNQVTASGTGATVYGGGLLDEQTTTIDTSTISGNTASTPDGSATGGGVQSYGHDTITNTTISANTAANAAGSASGAGGGIDYGGATGLTLINDTISGNAANGDGFSGGGGLDVTQATGQVHVGFTTFDLNATTGSGADLTGVAIPQASIFGGLSTTANCASGPVASAGDNIDTGSSCGLSGTGDMTGTDPRLAALADNGGPTQTEALRSGSPAINAAGSASCPSTDQRGLARPHGQACDIGSYEVGVGALLPPSVGPYGSELWGPDNPAEPGACNCTTQPKKGDPVNDATGNLTESATDLAVPGRGIVLAFTRTYNSLDAATATAPDALGYGWTDSYAANLTVDPVTAAVTVHQGDGATVTFTPDGAGGYTAPARVVATLAKSGSSYVFTLPDQTADTFNSAGQLVSEADRNANTTTLSYTGGRLATVTDPAGRSLSFGYNGAGQLTSVTDPAGRVVSYGYDGSGNLTSVTDPAGNTTGYGYDTHHRLTTITDPNGGVTTNVFDIANRVTSQTDPATNTTTFSYTVNPGGFNTTTVTDPDGNVTVEQFVFNELVSRTRGAGTTQAATWTFDHDSAGNIAAVTDPNGHTSTFSYDARANLLSATDALGHTSSFTYDARNDRTSLTDANNVTTTYGYDAHGNLTSVSTPLVGTGQTAITGYLHADPTHPGDVTGITDPAGRTSSFSYDSYGQLSSVSDAAHDTTSYSYTCTPAGPGCRSNIGWVYTTTSPTGHDSTVTRDDDSRLLTATDADGHTSHFGYDNNGNRTSVTDPDGHVTTTIYDADNRPTAVTTGAGTPAAATSSTRYDGNGNVSDQIDANNGDTSYGYDPLGRLSFVDDANNRTTTFGYDAAGNRTSTVSPDGLTTTYQYDAANRLTTISYSDGTTPTVQYSYDPDGQRLTMTDGTGTSHYNWDSLHRLTSTTDGAGNPVSYSNNLAGDVTSIGYPNGKTVTRGFDTAGRLASVTDWNNKQTTFGYDPDSNLQSITYPNGVTETYNHDHADQLTAITDTTASATLAGYAYARDPNGQLTATTPTGPTGQTNETYGYSTRNQLTGYTTTSSGSYAYDPAGNPTGLADGTSQTFDPANRLLTSTLAGATTTFGYNPRGDRTSATNAAGSVQYGYDQANRLTGYTSADGATHASYSYNGDGLRTAKTVNGTTSPFSWDQVTSSVPLLLSDGTTNYIYGPGGLPIEQLLAAPAITLVATSSASDNGTSNTMNLSVPAAVHPGDQLLVGVVEDVSQTTTIGGSWTAVGTYNAGSNAAARLQVFRSSTTANGGGHVTLTAANNPLPHPRAAVLLAYRGVDPADPLEDSNNSLPTTGSSVTVTAISQSDLPSKLVFFAGALNSAVATAWTAPTGTTSRASVTSQPLAMVLGVDQDEPNSGNTGNKTASINDPAPAPESIAAYMAVLRPLGAIQYLLHDQNGSTRIITNTRGSTLGTYRYDPYGRITGHSGPLSSALLYDGQYQDTETRQYYMRARYYDPQTAGFTSVDPAVSATRSAYTYADNNPTTFADPLGLASQTDQFVPNYRYDSTTGTWKFECFDVTKWIQENQASDAEAQQEAAQWHVDWLQTQHYVANELAFEQAQAQLEAQMKRLQEQDRQSGLGEIVAGVITIVGADLVGSSVLVASALIAPEALPLEAPVLESVVGGANVVGIGLIYDGVRRGG